MEKPPPKAIMQKSNRGFWEKMSPPDFKNFSLWKKIYMIKFICIIRHININRLYKEYVFKSYRLPLLNRNLMWAIRILSFLVDILTKYKGDVLVTFNQTYLNIKYVL